LEGCCKSESDPCRFYCFSGDLESEVYNSVSRTSASSRDYNYKIFCGEELRWAGGAKNIHYEEMTWIRLTVSWGKQIVYFGSLRILRDDVAVTCSLLCKGREAIHADAGEGLK
jgi:hypothetical protein